MGKSDGKVEFGHKFEVLKPATEQTYPVPVALWNKTMDRIKSIVDDSPFYDSLGWGLIGAGASATLSAIALLASAEFSRIEGNVEIVNWTAIVALFVTVLFSIAGIGGGGVSLRVGNDQKKHSQKRRDWLAEDMQSFADRHPLPQESPEEIVALPSAKQA